MCCCGSTTADPLVRKETYLKGLPLAIWAMVVGAFAMGVDEFIVAGVVQEIAADLKVTIGAVGLFESAYAIGVAIGAPLFTAIGSRVSRQRMLLATATVFVVGNLVSALGPSYNEIMAGRIISAMAHGAFLGIAAVFAADLVAPQAKGRAIAIVFARLTASTVLGAPIGAAVGRALGWRRPSGSWC
jgi:MFS transporter, DHA1 family, inner membrane transport protein